MDLLSRLNEVNKLRQSALSDPKFIEAAQEHEKAIVRNRCEVVCSKRQVKKRTLQEIYS